MISIDDKTFERYIDEAFDALPEPHRTNVRNVAILHADDPTPEQRVQNELRDHETLLGLYEGVPLSRRQGVDHIYPDKITLFKNPLCAMVETETQLREEIYHTLWHEIAHYYGLNHDQIHALE